MMIPPGLIAERTLIRELESYGATSPEKASKILPSGPIRRGRLLAMLEAGAIREESPHHYWVDRPVYVVYRAGRRRRGLAILVVLALAAGIYLYLRR